MKIDIQVAPQFRGDVNSDLVERAVIATLAGESVDELIEISILITHDRVLQRLNRDYRGINAPTDVLSFAEEEEEQAEGKSAFVHPPDVPRYLGDIAISYQRVIAQADEYGHSHERELAYLTAHGVLHLLGYDHERGVEEEAQMRAREEAAMERLGLPRG